VEINKAKKMESYREHGLNRPSSSLLEMPLP